MIGLLENLMDTRKFPWTDIYNKSVRKIGIDVTANLNRTYISYRQSFLGLAAILNCSRQPYRQIIALRCIGLFEICSHRLMSDSSLSVSVVGPQRIKLRQQRSTLRQWKTARRNSLWSRKRHLYNGKRIITITYLLTTWGLTYTWPIARYMKIIWWIICSTRASELQKVPPKCGF